MDEQLNDNVVNEAQEEVAAEEMQTVEKVESLADRVKTLSPGRLVVKRFFRSKLSRIGLVTLILLFAISFIGPLFSKWSANNGTALDEVNKTTNSTYVVLTYTGPDGEEYTAYDVSYTYLGYNSLGDITPDHWMGTTREGYDVFTRLMLGGRVSLTIGFVVVILETLLGVLFGGLAGYFGKWVDQLIMRIVDIISCIPTLPIMLILASVFNSLGIVSIARLYYVFLILTLIGWGGTARLVRGQILSLREQEFMLAAKCSGLSTAKKIFKHLLPNIIPQLIVSMTLGLGSVILTEATLGYLGIGAPLDTATWGNMINLASNVQYRNFYPNLWIGAGVCITLAILAFNFVGDGLRDAFDPKMKR